MWLWRAFNRLSTTRPRGFTNGPISYRETMWYADEMEFFGDIREFLWEVITRLDAAFLKSISDKQDQDATPNNRRESPRG